MNRPKRAIEVSMKLRADSWSDIKQELDHLMFLLQSRGHLNNSISGSPSTGHIIEVELNPDQTNEKYHSENDQYVNYLKQEDIENLRSNPRELHKKYGYSVMCTSEWCRCKS